MTGAAIALGGFGRPGRKVIQPLEDKLAADLEDPA